MEWTDGIAHTRVCVPTVIDLPHVAGITRLRHVAAAYHVACSNRGKGRCCGTAVLSLTLSLLSLSLSLSLFLSLSLSLSLSSLSLSLSLSLSPQGARMASFPAALPPTAESPALFCHGAG